jgi:penicillin-binding protein 2
MATSCNIYFMLLGVETGIDNIDLMGERLGLGEYSGIDLPGEICGVRASRDTKRLLHESEYDRTWFPADTAQSAIGQFDNCFTILQLCRYTAAIATNSLVTPYVIDSVVGSDGAILYQGQTESIPLGIQEENINAVRNAMRCVVTGTSIWEGTAQENLASFPIPVCCKTGTAETGYEDIRLEYSNGLFVCYAPADNPEIAIALVVEKGEWGASTVVIAEKILAEYFGVIYDQASAVIDSFPITGDYLDSVTPEAMPN